MTQQLREPSRRSGSRHGFGRVLRALAGAVRLVCGLFALILATHIAFALLGANPDNSITQLVADWSSRLTLGLRGLFTPDDPRIAILLDYGLPAIAWLVIGAIIARVLRAGFARRW